MSPSESENLDPVDELREEFRRLRERNGVSQSEVAAVLGLTQAAVSQFEHGSQPRRTTLHKIRQLVEVWKSDTSNIFPLDQRKQSQRFRCPHCLLPVAGPEDGARFCVKCGEGFPLKCSACDHTNPPRSRFCNQCARPLFEEGEKPRQRDERAAADPDWRRKEFLEAFMRWLDESGTLDKFLEGSR